MLRSVRIDPMIVRVPLWLRCGGIARLRRTGDGLLPWQMLVTWWRQRCVYGKEAGEGKGKVGYTLLAMTKRGKGGGGEVASALLIGRHAPHQEASDSTSVNQTPVQLSTLRLLRLLMLLILLMHTNAGLVET